MWCPAAPTTTTTTTTQIMDVVVVAVVDRPLSETPLHLLNLSHLRCLSIQMIFAKIRSTIAVSVVILSHRHPPVQTLWPKQQRERCAKLSAHRTVQNEIDRRINQRQNIHKITCGREREIQRIY